MAKKSYFIRNVDILGDKAKNVIDHKKHNFVLNADSFRVMAKKLFFHSDYKKTVFYPKCWYCSLQDMAKRRYHSDHKET